MRIKKDTIPSGQTPILTVRFYRTASGSEPVRAFLLELNAESRKAIGTDIKQVQFGWPLGMPLVRKMDNDLWEVRSHIAKGIARVLFTVRGDQMVLLHAFVKKSRQIPNHELKTALARMRQLQGGLQ